MKESYKDLLFYGFAYAEYNPLDFATDFLSGVRSNFFSSGSKQQSNRSVQLVGEDEYSYVFNMSENSPLSWKIYKNNVLLQKAEPVDENGYVVKCYDENNSVYQIIYFDNNHIWLKTEYISHVADEKKKSLTFLPKVVDGEFVIERTVNKSEDSTVSYLYPKFEVPEDNIYYALAFTNKGFVYFNNVPNDMLVSKIHIVDNSVDNFGGFNFVENDFDPNRNFNQSYDITKAQYLDLTSDNNTESNYQPETENIENTHRKSDYDDFEDIITIYKKSADKEKSTKEFENYNDEEIQVKDETPTSVIESVGEKYSYFGGLDDNGMRNGYGRTVTSEGKTAYDGEYREDKRNGFGSFYYKNGRINYVGNWENNSRQGFGIGFRNSDGTAHIGKWENNQPKGIGARFDNEGNFIFLGNYLNGKKQGLGITVDENNNFIISKFEDDEVVSSRLIEEDF